MKLTLSSLFLVLLFGTGAAFAKPGQTFAPLSPDIIAAIQAAVPAKAAAIPKTPRKILVFYRTEGFVHKSIPYGNEALKRLGETTGAYSVVISDDMAMFDPETLNQFDAVVFQNTTQLGFQQPEHRAALLDFVDSGKGLVGIHAATDNFPTWPEGQALIGGLFHNHPWTAKDVVAIKVDDPAHPVNAAFGGKGFWLREEIYQIVGPYGRDKVRVLDSLDMSKPQNARPAKQIVREDNDFPISWIKNAGKGRVFYSSLGHNADIFSTPQVLRHFLDGIQFAIGDLEADAFPLPQTVSPALAPESPVTLQEQSKAERAGDALE